MSKRSLCALVASFLTAATAIFDARAAVNFGFGTGPLHIYKYEKDGSVAINVFATGTGEGCTVAARNPTGTPPTTAIRTNDYSATASFSFAPCAENYGCASLTGVDTFGKTFTVGLVDNAVTNAEKQIGFSFWAASAGTATPDQLVVHILDDDFVVGVKATKSPAYEAGAVRGLLLFTHDGPTTYNVTVNFSRTASTATFNNDYTLSVTSLGLVTNSVIIPAGTNAVEVRVVPIDDGVVDPDETVTLTLASGYYAIDPTNTSATVKIIDDETTVSISATDTNASESGKSGLFTVTRTADSSSPVYVKYTLGGTANNGMDYAYLSNTVVIPAGENLATITVAPLFDYLFEGVETVTLTLVTNGYKLGTVTNATVSITDYDDNLRQPPVIGGGVSTNARYGRFTRGTGSNPDYQSFVIPIDFQQGIALNDIGGNAAALFSSNPWTNNFNHYNATMPGSPIPFANPIVAFGNKVGGSPMYYGQGYTFGVYAGDAKPVYAGSTNTYTNALRIQVYDRNTMALVGTSNIVIPNIATTNEWSAFLSNGYTKSVTAFGLTTVLAFNNGFNPWNLSLPYINAAYHLTHSGTATATQYVYLVELAGGTASGWLATNQ